MGEGSGGLFGWQTINLSWRLIKGVACGVYVCSGGKRFRPAVYLVFIPTGMAVCAVGMASRHFFRNERS